MIGYLSGTAIANDTILVNGVGYHVHTAAPLTLDEDVQVWVYTAVRENDISLFGFESPTSRELFVALMKVNGIGPRMAMALVGLGAGVVARALLTQDAKALSKAPGVGIRKAQTILTAHSLPEEFLVSLSGDTADRDPLADLVDALVSMGHDAVPARSALEAAALEAPGAAAPVLLRLAVRALSAPAVRIAN